MKITVNQLRRIIKEEVSRVLKENPEDTVTFGDESPDYNPAQDFQDYVKVTIPPGAKVPVLTTMTDRPVRTTGGKIKYLEPGIYEMTMAMANNGVHVQVIPGGDSVTLRSLKNAGIDTSALENKYRQYRQY